MGINRLRKPLKWALQRVAVVVILVGVTKRAIKYLFGRGKIGYAQAGFRAQIIIWQMQMMRWYIGRIAEQEVTYRDVPY